MFGTGGLCEPCLDGSNLRPHDIGAMVEDSSESGLDFVADAGLLGGKVDEGNHGQALSRVADGASPAVPNSVKFSIML